MRKQNHGFTLVELLVVVTIIVILLALLIPGLDRALYQADLAVCAAQLRSIGTGGSQYAMNNRRYYFYRAGVHDPEIGDYQPRSVSVPFNSSQRGSLNGYDDRPIMRPFVDVDALICPPAGDMSVDEAEPESYIYSSYSLWMGWKYRHANAGSGMLKLGDRLTQRHTQDEQDGLGWPPVIRFNVLAGDVYDVIWSGRTSAHPDDLGVMVHDEQRNSEREESWRVTRADPDAKITYAHWAGTTSVADPENAGHMLRQARADLNFLWDDLSVRRLDRVHWDPRDSSQTFWQGNPEPRTWPVASFVDSHPDNFNLLSIAK